MKKHRIVILTADSATLDRLALLQKIHNDPQLEISAIVVDRYAFRQ